MFFKMLVKPAQITMTVTFSFKRCYSKLFSLRTQKVNFGNKCQTPNHLFCTQQKRQQSADL